MKLEKAKKLASEIQEFLSKHAKKSAWEEDEYSSPDASMLAQAAIALESGVKPPSVWSSWGSGGYSPYTDEQARQWHDEIISKLSLNSVDVETQEG